jgi:drug/metabolite transporter (DMT)-like permease
MGADLGEGVGFAFAAACSFGLALAGTQHETVGMDGRVRTLFSLLLAGSVALVVIGLRAGPHWPQSPLGWQGLAMLTLLYGNGAHHHVHGVAQTGGGSRTRPS